MADQPPSQRGAIAAEEGPLTDGKNGSDLWARLKGLEHVGPDELDAYLDRFEEGEIQSGLRAGIFNTVAKQEKVKSHLQRRGRKYEFRWRIVGAAVAIAAVITAVVALFR